MSIELKVISDHRTQLKASYKNHRILIEQLKFIGAKPTKESAGIVILNLKAIYPKLKVCYGFIKMNNQISFFDKSKNKVTGGLDKFPSSIN